MICFFAENLSVLVELGVIGLKKVVFVLLKVSIG